MQDAHVEPSIQKAPIKPESSLHNRVMSFIGKCPYDDLIKAANVANTRLTSSTMQSFAHPYFSYNYPYYPSK